MRILIAEDDEHIAAGMQNLLVARGHAVDRVGDGKQAEEAGKSGVYQLLILDIGLPSLEGGEVIRRLRAARIDTPILVVSAGEALNERVRILDLGADDYLVKPFAIAEFDARVRAHLRRGSAQGATELEVGGLVIDPGDQRARGPNGPIELTAREFALVSLLAARAGRIVSRTQMMETICAWDNELTDNGLDIALHRLRRKIQDCGVRLRTIRGLGYLLEPLGNE